MKLAIDFGTSMSLASAVRGKEPVNLTRLDNFNYGIPSIVYGNPQSSVPWVVGKEAQDELRDAGEDATGFIIDAKMHLEQGDKYREAARLIIEEVIRNAVEDAKRKRIDPTIESLVVTAPANFKDHALSIIKDAATKAAGLDESKVSIIAEPVAAAVYLYHTHVTKTADTILVYDMGAGTCDCAVVRRTGDPAVPFESVDTDMTDNAGWKWDRALLRIIGRKVGADLTSQKDIAEAKRVKEELTDSDDSEYTYMNGGETNYPVVTRAELEDESRPLMEENLKMVERLIQRNNGVDVILCVGGSSNMPMIKQSLQERFPGIQVVAGGDTAKLNTTESIVFGAALWANGDFAIRQRSRFTYGLQVYKDYPHDKTLYLHNLIFPGAPLPATKKNTGVPIEDNQQVLEVDVYETKCTESWIPFEGAGDGTDKPQITVTFDLGGKYAKDEVEIRKILTLDDQNLLQIDADLVWAKGPQKGELIEHKHGQKQL